MRETAEPTSQTTGNEVNLSRFFKALSDDTRREILALLERRERNVTEIVDRFRLTQPTISRHLQVLREAGLVRSERHGQHVIYRLNQDALARAAEGYFSRFRRCRRTGFELPVNSLSQPPDLKPVPGGRQSEKFRFRR